ncbi:MAG: prepilin-type N-terminal cleavage/methylation domain-containing protein [Candidatus Saccharimonadales bacterium]
MRRLKNQRGDTLIEVLMGMSILGIVVITTMAMMNSGIRSAQNSLERTQVRTQIDSQVYLLRYMRDDYIAASGNPVIGTPGDGWKAILTNSTPPTDYLKTGGAVPVLDDTSCSPPSRSFYVDVTIPSIGPPVVPAAITLKPSDAAQIPVTYSLPGKGLWIEAYEVVGTSSAYKAIDFVIRACWQPFGSGPSQYETTIVRLYDGR